MPFIRERIAERHKVHISIALCDTPGMSNTGRSWNLALHSLVALAVGAIGLPPARAQFVQQGGKLVGTGAVGRAAQGNAVALSADGNTVIVGGSRDNGEAGAAWEIGRAHV